MIRFREKFYITFSLNLEFSKKLDKLINMCINENYNKVRVGRFLSEAFQIHCGLKQRDALSPLLFIFALKYYVCH